MDFIPQGHSVRTATIGFEWKSKCSEMALKCWTNTTVNTPIWMRLILINKVPLIHRHDFIPRLQTLNYVHIKLVRLLKACKLISKYTSVIKIRVHLPNVVRSQIYTLISNYRFPATYVFINSESEIYLSYNCRLRLN